MNALYILIISHATASVPSGLAVTGPVTQAQCDKAVAGSTKALPIACASYPEVLYQLVTFDCKEYSSKVLPNLALGASTQSIYVCR